MMRVNVFLAKTKFKKWRVNGTDAQRYSVAHDWSCPDKQGQIHGSFVNLIHGVDSFKLLKRNKQALKTTE
jgi:hypothetical protein